MVLREVNAAYLRFFETTAENVVGRTPADLGHIRSADLEKFRDTLVVRGALHDIEVPVSNPAGRPKHGIFSAESVEMDGELSAIVILYDITARMEAEAALRESAEQLRLAVRSSNLGPWDWDLRTNTVYFSPEWKRQIGYEDHEVQNRYEEWESRLHPEDREPTLAALRAYMDGVQPDYTAEFRRRYKDGSDLYAWRGPVRR